MRKNPNFDAPWLNIPPHPPLLRPSEVVRVTGLSKSVVYDNIARSLFPPFLKIGARASAMPKAWLDAFLETRAEAALAGRNADCAERISTSRDGRV